ncbi:hypothetical protein [Lactococcus lactis]|uniref:hypothetical protein n=1 Tax=Lactococcus lactis TaxID=1358 RepID=UPI002417D502|nr:hypothetical protein [Lactococcus lactis]MDG4958537.1 hypothetical protein [Lactococcus lactis]
MISNIIIIVYALLIIYSTLAQVFIIGEKREPVTHGNAIANIIITAAFLTALYFKL